MPNSEENLATFKKNVDCKIFTMSAINNEGIDEILIELANLLENTKDEPLYEETEYLSHVLYKFKKEEPYEITKEDDCFVIRGEQVERLFKMTKFGSEEGILRFAKTLRKMGIDDKLEKMGAVEGDIVKILDFTFEYRR